MNVTVRPLHTSPLASRELFQKSVLDGFGASAVGGISGVNGVQGGMSLRSADNQARVLSPSDSYALNIAVNAAVNAIAQNIAKAAVRIFLRDGTEVFDGELYQLLRRPNNQQNGAAFITDFIRWYNIQGESAALKSYGPDGSVVELRVLNPSLLQIWPANRYKTRDDIDEWRYLWNDGTFAPLPDSSLIFTANLNPIDPVRGLSPTSVAATEIGILHWSARSNLARQQNGGIPSHLIVLPENTPRKERDDFERKYLAQHNNYGHNGNKVLVVSGGDVKFVPLDNSVKDGEWMGLRQQMLAQVAMIYRIPAIEIGLYDKTRFDTAGEERKLFLESTLMPQIEMLTATLQRQLVDANFSIAGSSTISRPAKMRRSLADKFDARLAASNSDLIILVDSDTLPIAHEVMAAQADRADKLRHAFGLSLQETCDMFGLEVDDRPERKDVYLLATDRNITQPEKNVEIMAAGMKANGSADGSPASQDQATGDSKPPRPQNPKDRPRPSKEQVRAATKAIRGLRKLSLQCASRKEAWMLRAGDDACQNPEIHKAIRLIRGDIGQFMLTGDEQGIRKFFNAIDPEDLVETVEI